jgi:hypothetical protein
LQALRLALWRFGLRPEQVVHPEQA